MISLIQLGSVDYATGLKLQQQLVALRKEEKIGDVLLLLEHKPVITLGRNAKAANVVASPELLAHRGVELFETNRGGDVTFHGPGQLVGYPIFDLRGFAREGHDFSRANRDREKDAALAAEGMPNSLSSQADSSPLSSRGNRSDGESRDPVFAAAATCPTISKHLGAVDFVRRIEEVLIRTCADFRLETKRIPGLTGVWTEPGNAHVGTAAPGCPVEQSSTATCESVPGVEREQDTYKRDWEGCDFSRSERDSTLLSSRAEENDPLADRSLESRDLAFSDSHPESKLAAIGIHISRFVTSHGFALNVNTDLSCFSLIVPCGITAKPVTSMRIELGHPVDLNTVAESISRNFGVVFQTQILWLDSLDALLDRAACPVNP